MPSTQPASAASPSSSSRLIVVSNRLPITITKNAASPVTTLPANGSAATTAKPTTNGTADSATSDPSPWSYAMSSGGLVSALSGMGNAVSFQWFGWPGLEVSPEDQATVRKDLMEKYAAVPVFISDEIADMHYNGFSNSILWPLFHYHPGEINFQEDHWDAYQQANLAFAQVLEKEVKDGDLVWIHDYHLMLLPKLLRERLSDRPNVKIGFFLHTPFPSSEIYRILPVRKQVLMGLLQCDLVGFHTYDYARHFLSSCTRILGLYTLPNGVEFEGRLVHVGTFPIGIDPDKFTKGVQSERIQARIARLEKRFAGLKVFVGVDRLDYIKGVPQKLHAFELFLTKHPEWVERVVLIQVAVPSRQDVEEYQHLRTVVNELVGRINGRFGTVDVNFEELVALYSIADACVVSSTRDGMNLVSYEYIACQQKRHGVLILSEFAGAAQSLNGSIIVNPWNTDELSNSYYEAVTLSEETREANHQNLYRYITKHTASHWGSTFVNELQTMVQGFDPSKVSRLNFTDVISKFKASKKKKLIFVDYDGTLTAAHRVPEYANPSKSIIDFLKQLTEKPDVFVYILSGRSRTHLEQWFGNVSVGLSAEHGCFYRHPAKAADLVAKDTVGDSGELSPPLSPVGLQLRSGSIPDVPLLQDASEHAGVAVTMDPAPSSSNPRRAARQANDGWLALVDQVDSSWRDTIRPLFEHYTERTPGSFIEEKEINLTWHYRSADLEFGSWQAAELHVNLEKILSHLPVSVILGNKTLEVRPSMIDKGSAARAIATDLVANTEFDFYLCIGDGKTDEVVFQYVNDLSDDAITCTVGKKRSEAKHYVEDVKDVEGLLVALGNV
ncbi:glycosyltransferase family 20-domain-containing protein [Zopfochytrium polystomum]|nr:glycosyltransferase family 20-domain-containing protein [Zopfochytrium polystomum]